jgi:hypothetical protein
MRHPARTTGAGGNGSGLVVRRIGEEAVVYDPATHRAHCLNRTARPVFERGEGAEDIVAAEIAPELRLTHAEALSAVRLGRRQLARAGLRGPFAEAPAPARSRRRLLRRLTAASLLPLVQSVVAPSPAEAQTCLPRDSPCTSSSQCCPEVPCCRRAGPPGAPARCRPGGGGCLP